jgi:membrane-associated protease RseP (regulator of RpoE activity)
MTLVLTTLGFILFFVGLMLSIAWHELGHMATAKMFGIRCTQFMVGFGKTLWSRTWGDTEYGIKAVPLGGFVRIVGMIPPAKQPVDTSAKPMSRWRAMIEDVRESSQVEVQPGDEDRQFYQRAPWKRLIVMFAGPVMNLILAVVLFAVVMMGFGLVQPTNTVAAVNECVVAQGEDTETCPADAPATPAADAGVEPGDTVVAVNGQPTPTWQDLQTTIRESVGPATIEVERDGEVISLETEIVAHEIAALDENGDMIYRTDADGENLLDEDGFWIPETTTGGFLGVSPLEDRVQLSAGESAERMGEIAYEVGHHLVTLPTKIPGLWDAAFMGAEREPDSPVGVVGASRIGGEIAAMEIPLVDRTVLMLMMLASVNLFLFAFNMLPILPLDGGHILGGIWESIRRWFAKLFRRPDPGPFDVAQLMPVAYIVVALFIGLSLLLLVADVVNPVRLVS